MKDFLKDLIEECVSVCLEEGMRIQHAEDLIFWEGQAGAIRALKSILDLEKGGYKNLTIKWDGSPTIVFGRNSSGQFILTNKAGFLAKGYDGKAKSGEELERMFLNMGKVPASEKSQEYKTFASDMKKIFPYFEKSTPLDFRGFFTGDLLFIKRPVEENGKFVFKPGIVTYKVDVDSEFGKRIEKSKCGLVIHRQLDVNGENERPATDTHVLIDAGVFVVPPVTVQSPPKIDKKAITNILKLIKSNGRSIDELLNQDKLAAMQLSNFSEILYTYTNSKVDSGLEYIGKDFESWLMANEKISEQKKNKISDYIKTHKSAFDSLWEVISGIMDVKDRVIDQLESQSGPISATIGDYKGGEGYVLSHPTGDMKFVSRKRFTAASRAAHKKPTVTEGGNVFKSKDGSLDTTRINRADVLPTVKWLESITGLPLVNNILGTGGKRETSGDLDLAVNESSMTKDALVEILSKWCSANRLLPAEFLKKSGDSVHFKTPINGSTKNGFVQTDFMFGDVDWMRWSLQGGKENSEYKGMHRHVLLASIAKFKNMKWSYKNGLVDRESGQTITKDPSKIAVALLGPGAKPSDLDYFESIIDKIKSNKDFEKMVGDARSTLIKYGVKF